MYAFSGSARAQGKRERDARDIPSQDLIDKAEKELIKRRRAAQEAVDFRLAAKVLSRFYQKHVRGNGVVTLMTQNMEKGASIDKTKSIRYNAIVYSDGFYIGMFVNGLY